MHVTVVVMGDLSRSPRILHHVESLLASGAAVDVICQLESPLPHALAGAPHLRLFAAPAPARWRRRLPRPLFIAYTALRLTGQAVWLLATLLRSVRPGGWVLVQNPPGIPVLWLSWATTRLRRAHWMVDWHNLGYSLLGIALGHDHALVRWARRHELYWGASADRHLCVSKTMAAWLQERGIDPIQVFQDHADPRFQPIAEMARRAAVAAVRSALPVDLADLLTCGQRQRPGILVSASSWSADEDLPLLLDALCRCDATLDGRGKDPALVVLLTGKGPGRAAFEQRLAQTRLVHVAIRLLWLPHDAYPTVLALADLGVSLHRSSSGLDIPMKVIDMLAAGLPVCALDYGAPLLEVLDPGVDSLLFQDAAGLAQRLSALFAPDGKPSPALVALRQAVLARRRPNWHEAWREQVYPQFQVPTPS
jgi:beta-1,4-mannosyltransferase